MRFAAFTALIIISIAFVSSSPAADKPGAPRKCIMVFGAHADDVEEMAGGTLAKFIADGYQGVYVSVVKNFAGNTVEKVPGNFDFVKDKVTGRLSGSPRTYGVDALETEQMREEEALRAARVFGAEPVFLNFREPEIMIGRKLAIYGSEAYLNYDPPGGDHVSIAGSFNGGVDVVVDLLRKYQPEITIIHCMGGEKLDHSASGYLVYLAFTKALARGIPVGKLWMVRYGWLADSPAKENGRGKTDVTIDITKYRDVKLRAWNQHLSQNGGDIEADLAANYPAWLRNVEEFITVIDNSNPQH